MKIGELSEKTGASPRMLRYYEQQGLLKPARTEGRFRVFDEADIARVKRIRCLLDSALPVPVIKQVVEWTCDAVLMPADRPSRAQLVDVLEGELASLEAKIAELTASRAALTDLVAAVRTQGCALA